MKTLFVLLILAVMTGRETPELNQKVLDYVQTVMGKKVDRGECWDLAAAALKHAGAHLDLSSQKTIYDFGQLIDPKREAVYAGDIVQFENVTVEYADGNTITTETMGHHTAIIYAVLGDGDFQLAHQNTSFSGRKVGVSNFKLNNVKKGKVKIYRPEKK
jgi:hypothetical protein